MRRRRKYILFAFLAIFLFNIMPVPAPAASANQVVSGEEVVDRGGPIEQVVATIVNFTGNIFQCLWQLGGFQKIEVLVFQQGLSDTEKKALPWTPAEAGYVKLWFQALLIVTAPFFIFAVISSGFKLLQAGANPAARVDAMESIQRWFIAIAIVALTPVLISTLMWICSLLVDAIVAGFVSVTTGMGRGIADIDQINLADLRTGSVLGTAIVRVFFYGIFGYINALYIIRKVALTVFFCFTPLMAILWCINKNTVAFAIWLGEIASNAFMPVAHALAFCTVLLLCDVKNLGSGTWLTIAVVLYSIIPLAEAIRNSLQSVLTNWAGMNEEETARQATAAVFGLGGIMSMGRVARATFGSRGGGNTPQPTNAPKTPPQQTIQPQTAQKVKSQAGGGHSTTTQPRSVQQTVRQPATSQPQTVQTAQSSIPLPQTVQEPAPARTQPQTIQPAHVQTQPQTVQKPAPVQPQPASASVPKPKRYGKAVRVGATAGKVAALGAGALTAIAVGATPGGEHLAKAVSVGAGAVTRVAATGACIAGVYIADRVGEATKSSGDARKIVQAGQAVENIGMRVKSVLTGVPITSLSLPAHPGMNVPVSQKKARYLDNRGSLDGPRIR